MRLTLPILRVQLRRLQREHELTTEQSLAIDNILKSRHSLVSLQARVTHHSEVVVGALGDGKLGDRAERWAKWFWDNRDAVVKFILDIVKLFS